MSCIDRPESIDQPESQEDILAACEASLTKADIPPDEDAYGWPDPDCGMPAELLALPDAELEELIAAAPSRPTWMVREAWPDGIVPPGGTVPDRDGGSVWPAGFLVRDGSGGGTGFADGGPLDVLTPGAALAGFADDTCAHIGTLSDDELIGVIRAWRRQTSWAQAQELAAVAELARRRPANDTPPAPPARPVSPAHESHPGFPRALSEFIADELAAALTLTHTAAEAELGLALDLAIRLPGTAAALRTGRIDLPRAKIIVDGTSSLTAEHAAAVERAVLPPASADAQPVPRGPRFPGPEEMVPPLGGSVHVTVPLTTLLGLSDAPGSAAGYGPLDPDSTRALACAAAGHPTTRWLFTVTSPVGQALGHGRARRPAKRGGDGSWTVTITARPIASGDCDHHNQEPGYRPSPGLQELIRTRSRTCTFPGCRHPAVGCDLDHSIPYDDGGITCECNLAPVCNT